MQIKDLQAKTGNVDIILDIASVETPREFNKFGKSGKVANAKAVDATGQIKISLWNEQIDLIKPGAKIHITNGWVNEWQGELQLTTGKFGKLEVISHGAVPTEFASSNAGPKIAGPKTETVKKSSDLEEETDPVEEENLDDDY